MLRLAALRPSGQWALLVSASAALGGGLAWAGLPAALLLGAMLAGIGAGALGFRLAVPNRGVEGAQVLLGLLIGHAVTGQIVRTVVADGPLMLVVVLVTVGASALVGWALTRSGALPGTTAAWGSSPGGASAMTALAESAGADVRFVAVMQYVRVVAVVVTATLVGRLWAGPAGLQAAPVSPAPPASDFAAHALLEAGPLAATLALGLVGAAVARRLRVPAGIFIGPMLFGAAVNGSGLFELVLPSWLLAIAYATIGWTVGLRFTAPTLRAALRVLPAILASTFGLIALCGAFALLLTRLAPIDLLTAYLATSPGGIDTVAIIALGTGADVSFVLAAQVLRLFVVLLAGPAIARLIARAAPPAA